MQHLVSIIIPVYNGEEFLQRAIDSCLNQTYVNFEVLIIDNCSTDKTSEIGKMNAARDSRIKYIYTDEKGLANARNIGLDNMTGNYFQFLDADDEILPEKLTYSMEKFRTDSELVAVCSGVKFVKNGQEIRSYFTKAQYPDQLLAYNLLYVPQPLLKKGEHYRFSKDLAYIEDWDYWLRALYDKHIYLSQEYIGTVVHIHENNHSQSVFKMYEGGLQVSLKSQQLYPKRSIRVRIYDFLYLLIYAYNKDKSVQTNTLISKGAKNRYKVALTLANTPILGKILYLPLKKRIENNPYM